MQAYYTYSNTNSTGTHKVKSTPKGTLGYVKLKKFTFFFTLFLICFSFGAVIQAYGESTTETNKKANNNNLELSFNQVSSNVNPRRVLVDSGDTLWSIAEAHAPKDKNIRSYISDLRKMNHLVGSLLQEGQILVLP
ncbi:hypothetical protein SY83_18000 [Paenibacillus swuensis]|uniref:LysM domain-containing protein n=1 Tax=Paenibacillus swuensis TaxID=1178515 RepID=A0A172TLF8_9BACL|nr:LysM peptidoglycan-binding domain-containing protein [Paenibacillus swuensis]ANE47871.1 hypothetical protein SY83_18000 [Paenibacillus swuensis]